jgi:hypothetical protein
VDSQVVTQVVIGVLVLGLLIYRQLVPRRVSSSSLRLMLILGVIGVIEAVQFFGKHHDGGLVLAALAGSLLLAIIFGVVRAATVRVWLQDGSPWTQGNWVTALLWVAALAAHLGYDALLDHNKGTNGLGTATIVLYLAITLAVQRGLVLLRAQRLDPGGTSAPFTRGPGAASNR